MTCDATKPSAAWFVEVDALFVALASVVWPKASRLMMSAVGSDGSDSRQAAEPFIETYAAETRLAQRHERVLLDPAAAVSGLGIAHDLARVADCLQVAGDDLVERRSFRAGDLDDAVARRRERHIGNVGRNVVRSDRLEQDGREPDQVSIRT